MHSTRSIIADAVRSSANRSVSNKSMSDSAAIFTTENPFGAMFFIGITLVFYSLATFISFLTESNQSFDDFLSNSKEIFNDEIDHRQEILSSSFYRKAWIFTDQMILGELADRSRRDQLWDIYFGPSNSIDQNQHRAEIFRIRNLEKQLVSKDENCKNSFDRSSIEQIIRIF